MERTAASYRAGLRLLRMVVVALLLAPGAAAAAREWNLPPPATTIAQQMFDLHVYIFWICVVIFVGVFGVMFYSIFRHRKSVGHAALQFHENTLVEIVWTVIPFIILLAMAYPATRTILAMKDTSAPDMTVKVTGYQWKWGYDYLQDGFGFYSTMTTPVAQIEGREASGGIIRPRIDPVVRAQWPEAFYLIQRKTRLSYTLEAPSDFPLATRVAALVAATQAALRRVD